MQTNISRSNRSSLRISVKTFWNIGQLANSIRGDFYHNHYVCFNFRYFFQVTTDKIPQPNDSFKKMSTTSSEKMWEYGDILEMDKEWNLNGPTISSCKSDRRGGKTGLGSNGGIIDLLCFATLQGWHWLMKLAISDFMFCQ